MCGGILPTFLINGEVVYFSRPLDYVNASATIKNGKICLSKITEDIQYLEVCHTRRSFCSWEDEFTIFKRGEIKVTAQGEKTCPHMHSNNCTELKRTHGYICNTENCGSCYNQCGLEGNSVFAEESHCGM